MIAHISQEILKQQAHNVYSRMKAGHGEDWGLNLDYWDWVPGVGVISILEYYEQSKREDVMGFLEQWAKNNLAKSEKMKVINSMAPFAIFPALFRHSKDPLYLEAAVRIGEWILKEAPRTREGALEHTVTENASFPEQVWADTIFMAVLLLARLAKQTGEALYAAEAVNQLEVHLRLLQEPKSGVLYHGWSCMEQNHMSSALWTRANAWIAVGTPMILEEVKGLTDIPAAVTGRYTRMMEGLAGFQQQNGLWATVMNQPRFYQETSGSAGIACGILKGVRAGLLPESLLPAAGKALKGVLSKIRPDGEVTGVSGGTPVMPSMEAYNDIPCYPTQYGQGLVLMLLAEAQK
ncbi:glycoside hydrolase family 88/105 protein [Gorillibacterium sp. sgz5001074]|uniref:glycoside hydrolase family 88/105 protein n=1 Tax=Gorillibacterium sp. sgz5001074 TaxID=3446695 RepID=UPI003F67AA31